MVDPGLSADAIAWPPTTGEGDIASPRPFEGSDGGHADGGDDEDAVSDGAGAETVEQG